ncbi:MAG: hypothetical protein CMJ40_02580 [Phycisphaerae bacterium]|nr:hypothetical protein [Phycisphaerae bacterium]|tara:strand:+ start:1243 stop:1620 length:378 start_codon:yes stop_codon:yes gene_type:complete
MAHAELDNQLDLLEGDTEDPKGGPSWLIMIAGTILTFVTCVAVSGLYYGAERREQDTKYISVASQAKETQRAANRARLMEEAHWETYTDASGDMIIDRKLKVPIDHAMGLVVSKYSDASEMKAGK